MPTTYNFTGQRLDSQTGLLYYNFRYYDPVSGRFVRADTVQNNAGGMDPYAYVGDSPEGRTDATGHDGSWWQTALTITAIAVVLVVVVVVVVVAAPVVVAAAATAAGVAATTVAADGAVVAGAAATTAVVGAVAETEADNVLATAAETGSTAVETTSETTTTAAETVSTTTQTSTTVSSEQLFQQSKYLLEEGRAAGDSSLKAVATSNVYDANGVQVIARNASPGATEIGETPAFSLKYGAQCAETHCDQIIATVLHRGGTIQGDVISMAESQFRNLPPCINCTLNTGLLSLETAKTVFLRFSTGWYLFEP